MLGRSVSRSIISRVARNTVRFGSHESHGPMMPPFARQRPPAGLLPRDIELVWDDSVAPETAVDFDAPHVSTKQAVLSFLAAMGFFVGIYQFVKWTDPVAANPVAPRSAVLDNDEFLYLMGMGPDPQAANADEE